MTKKQKKMLIRIIIAAVMLAALHFIPVTGWLRLALYLVTYVVIGCDIMKKAGQGILNGRVFDENFLMAVATIGAFALAIYEKSGDYNEAIAVMLFYQIGELFQSYAVGKSRKNISALMDIRPDYANIEQDGQLVQVDPDEVAIGTVIVVQPGEKVPIDGVITEGRSTLNTSALTGESLPRDAQEGDEIISGCINMTGLLKIRTTKEFGESTVSKILELVENSSSRKSRSEDFIARFARIYTPAGGSSAAGGRHGRSVGAVDLPRPDVPCYQLPLRAGSQHPPELLRRYRRRQQGGHPRQGLQLSGDAVPGEVCGV